MNRNTFLKIFFSSICITMSWLVFDTAGRSNMFELDISEPWFKTLLIDFYLNTIILSAWVVYKERTYLARILWIAGFWLTGAVATSLYVVIQLNKLRPGDSFDKVLVPVRTNTQGRAACSSIT